MNIYQVAALAGAEQTLSYLILITTEEGISFHFPPGGGWRSQNRHLSLKWTQSRCCLGLCTFQHAPSEPGARRWKWGALHGSSPYLSGPPFSALRSPMYHNTHNTWSTALASKPYHWPWQGGRGRGVSKFAVLCFQLGWFSLCRVGYLPDNKRRWHASVLLKAIFLGSWVGDTRQNITV